METDTTMQRKKYGIVFSSMVQMMESLKTQLKTLVKERKILQDHVEMQHDRWISDTRHYENTISQMKGDMLLKDMERSFDASKFDFVLGLKQREAYRCQFKQELTDDELADFKEIYDLLYQKYSTLSEDYARLSLETSKSNGRGQCSEEKSSKTKMDYEKRSRVLEDEIRMLKEAFEKLKSEKDSEISALMAEKRFVWNQYNIMENDYTSKLRNKSSDFDRANLKIEKLLSSMEELQNSNNEKDESISTLKSELGKMGAEASKLKKELEFLRRSKTAFTSPVLKPCNSDDRSSGLVGRESSKIMVKKKDHGEASKLKKELEFLRRSKTAFTSPVLKPCNSDDRNCGLVGRESSKIMVKKKEASAEILHPAKSSKKGSRSLKRKENEAITIDTTPNLFSSSTKIPKLKATFHR